MKDVLRKMAENEKANLQYTVVALGDSVTDGCFESGVKDFDAVYHNQLKRLINGIFPNLRVNMIDSGIGGISTVGSTDRLERDVFAYAPDLVIVCLGLNDLDGDHKAFFRALADILTRIRQRGIEVIYMTPNMVDTRVDPNELTAIFGSDGYVGFAQRLAQRQTNGEIDRVMARAIETAKACGAEVCDCYGAWRRLYDAGTDTTKLLCNRINHPSRAMHRLFAAELLHTILN